MLFETRPSSFYGVEKLFCLDVMQPVNNIQVYGWAALPNIPCHGPVHFAVLNNFLVWMVRNFSKTLDYMAGPWNPKHGPVLFTVLKNFFRLDVMQLFWKFSSLWLGRAPQHPLSRPSSFRGVKESFRLDVMETINNVQRNGWSCYPNTIQLIPRC